MFLTGISFTVMDIIVYGILILFLLVGLFKGLVKIVFSFLKGIVTLVITYFLTTPTRNLLYKTGLDDKLTESISKSLLEKAPSLGNTIDVVNYKDQVFEATQEASIPEFIGKIISNIVNLDDVTSGTIGDAISSSLTMIIMTVISFLIIFVVFSIGVLLLSKLFSYLVSFGGLKTIDRILGMVINGIYGLLLVSLVFLVMSSISSVIPSVGEFIDGLVYPGGKDIDTFSIAKWLYENNPMKFILEGLVK